MGSFLRKGEVFAYVGRNQNLKDPNNLRTRTRLGVCELLIKHQRVPNEARPRVFTKHECFHSPDIPAERLGCMQAPRCAWAALTLESGPGIREARVKGLGFRF